MISAYWTECIHSRNVAEITMDNNKILHKIHYFEHHYVPVDKINAITHGDQEVIIEKTDGKEIYGISEIKFGNLPFSADTLEKMRMESDIEHDDRFDYYVIYEEVYVNHSTSEHLKALNKQRPNKNLWNIIFDIEQEFKTVPTRNAKLLEVVRNELITQIMKSYSSSGMPLPQHLNFDIRWSDILGRVIDVKFDTETFKDIQDIL